MKKRIFAMFLVVSMVLSIVSVGAVNTSSVSTDVDVSDVVNGHNINIIPSNVAEVLALIFVEENVEAGLSKSWTANTNVSEVVPMFDEDGIPTAFSVELDTDGKDSGYVVISAYPEVENYILEYADTAAPIYEELDVNSGEEIVYTSVMSYLKDDGSDSLTDVQGQEIDREDITNSFESTRNAVAFEAKKDDIVEVFQSEPAPITRSAYDQYGAIVDPLAYIEAVYGGSAYNSAYEWKNILEPYTKHCVMRSFSATYSGNCGPTAITNMIETAGNYYNINTVKGKNIQTIYNNIESIGLSAGWFTSDGVKFSIMDKYINRVLNSYTIPHLAPKTWTSSKLSYDIMKQEINANHFCVLGVIGHNPYKNHFVYPYAYTRFKNSQTGYYKSFLKVADGWSSSGRYIDMASIISTTSTNSYLYSVTLNV